MPYHRATYRRFLRHVYTNGGASAATRSAYIAAFTSSAVSAIGAGKHLVTTSAGAHSVSYQLDAHWTAQDVMEMAEWAEDYVTQATITASLAEVEPRVTSFYTDTTNLRVMG